MKKLNRVATYGAMQAVALLLLAPTMANAQWTFEPIAKIGVERDDNATLSVRTDDVQDVSGILADLIARISYQSPLTSFNIEPRVISRRYEDAEELDSDDIFLRSIYSHRGISNTLGFRFNYDRQTARTAERSDADLDVDDPEDIPDDETGFVGFQDNRHRLRFAPSWRHDFSTATSMTLGASYLKTTYDGALQLFLNDVNDTRLALSFDRAFSDRTTGIVMGTARKYKLENGSGESDGVSLSAGFQHSLSETTNAQILIGIEDTESDISKPDPVMIADMYIRKRLETINMLAQYRRSVAASGIGRLSVRDSININLSRLLSEKITVGLGVRMYQTNSLDDVVTIDERNYVQLRSQLIWHMSQNFSTEFDYRYTFQKRAALEESANSNQINVWFVYRPNSSDRRFRPVGSISTKDQVGI